MSEEYFIRNEGDDDNRGPYDMDQLATLAEAGKVSLDTLFFIEDPRGESPENAEELSDELPGEWKALKDVPALKSKLFPEVEMVKLKLAQPKVQEVPVIPETKKNSKKNPKTLENVEKDPKAPIGVSVNEVLDSAEGKTDETRHLKRKEKEKNKAAALSLPCLGIAFLLSAFAIGWTHYEFLMGVFNERTWGQLLKRPISFVFAVDLVLGLGMLLSASEIFPIVRLRAMLGMGFFAYFFWSTQGYGYAWASVAFGVGVMCCSLSLNLPAMIFGVVCVLGGSGYLAFSGYLGDLGLFFAY